MFVNELHQKMLSKMLKLLKNLINCSFVCLGFFFWFGCNCLFNYIDWNSTEDKVRICSHRADPSDFSAKVHLIKSTAKIRN